jgi:hypothetical protein
MPEAAESLLYNYVIKINDFKSFTSRTKIFENMDENIPITSEMAYRVFTTAKRALSL